MTDLELAVLRFVATGPVWARSLQARGAKPLYARLIDEGLVERLAPAPKRPRNMLGLTDAGARAILLYRHRPIPKGLRYE